MKSNTVKVQPLLPVEFKHLAQLYAEIASASDPAFFNWTESSALAEFQQSLSFIVKIDNSIQAFVTFRIYDDRLEIMAIGTKPSARKQGFAEKLLTELKVFAAQRSLPVWLEVHENNQTAVSFYGKNQFSVINRRKHYYSDGGTALVMRS